MLSADDMVALMKKSLDMETRHYKMLLLYGVHVRLGKSLQPDFCLYVNLVGPKECGKTHVSKYVTEMCKGVFVSRATNAYILRKMDKLNATGTLLGIDQLDEKFKQSDDADLQDVLENGHTWSAIYGLTEKNKNKIEVIELGCGGPKIFNSLIPPRPTLRSRTYEIEVYATQNPSCIVNYTQRDNDVKLISDSLDAYATAIKQKFNVNDEKNILMSQAHQDSATDLMKKVGGRRVEMFNAFELCRNYASSFGYAGWDIDTKYNLSYEIVDEDEDVFRWAVLHAFIMNKPIWSGNEVDAGEFSKAMSQSLRDYGMKPMTPNMLGRWMTNIGLGKSPFKIRKGDTNYYVFSPAMVNRLYRTVPTVVQSTFNVTNNTSPPVTQEEESEESYINDTREPEEETR